MSELMISVDWDFFPVRAEGLITLDSGRDVPADIVFDWGQSEAPQHGFQGLLWASRFQSWHAFGLDLEKHLAIDPQRGSVPVELFAETLRDLYDFERVTIADSHAHGYFALHQTSTAAYGPVPVLHFDAHHDIGYAPGVVAEMEAAGHFDCSTWLRESAATGYTEDVTIIYPEWRGLREWETTDRSLRDDAEEYARAMTWADWLPGTQATRRPKRTADLFLCRSSAWTPPWLDADFERLAGLLSESAAVVERNADLLDREWDRDQQSEQAEAVRGIIASQE